MTTTNDSATPRRLSPWNPLDHLRLLWWVLVMPQRLVAYRETCGENAERSASIWLSSTLTWLPPFILILALGLGTLPDTDTAHLSTVYLYASGALILAWVLTSRLGEETGCAATIVAFGVILPILVAGLAFRVMGDVGNSVAAILIIGLTLGITVSIAPAVPSGVSSIVTFLVMTTASVVAGRSAFLVAFVVWAVVGNHIERVVKENLKTGRSSWLAQGAFGALVLAYALLIWFSFIGGWRMFR